MLPHWTVLWITLLSGEFRGEATYLAYTSYPKCIAAIETVTATLDYDYIVGCEESVTPSVTPMRPKKRPW